MKKFRILLVLAMVVAMISTVVMAADFDFVFDGDSIEYSDAGVTVKVVATGTWTTADGAATVIKVNYDPAVWSLSTKSAQSSTNITTGTAGVIEVLWDAQVTFDTNFNVLTAAFVPAAGATKADMLASKFSIDSCEIWDADWNVAYTNASEIGVEEAAQAVAPTYTGTVNPKATLNGVDDVYTGVWAANYTVALNGNAITKVGLRFADKADDAFAVAKTADGEGSVAFKIAIVGAPADAVATPIVYTTEWIAAEAE